MQNKLITIVQQCKKEFQHTSAFFNFFLISTFLKLLLTPGYKSTDFEVHRNWLAITHHLPIHDWYYNASSEWTLDYPPFFAYFEFLLSHLAYFWDPRILYLEPMKHYSPSIIVFQRLTVMVSDLLLFFGVWICKYEILDG
ncbi:glycosyl transferase [Coelomomyces lativittatus]|nr:glycosyl transferase [Coelomomyces lativittatus]